MKKILATITLVALFVGCYKAEFRGTDHPYHAEVTFYITLPGDAEFEGSKGLIFDGEEYDVTPGETFTIPYLVDPGIYTYYIFTNHTDDEQASVVYDGEAGTLIATVDTDEDGYIYSNPNQIYFDIGTIELLADSSVVIHSESSVLGRDLNFKLELTGDAPERLVGFSAMLNGVAQQWDCINDTHYGESATVLPGFIKTEESPLRSIARSDASTTYYLEGTIHILGITTDESQILTLELSYEDDHPSLHTITTDLTNYLSTFNDDRSTAMTLTNTVETPTEANPNGSIGDWNTTDYEVEAK